MSNRDSDRPIPHRLRTAALGQVTAGIVHDANNGLAVAVWNIERATRAVAPGTKEADSARTAINSTMKAAGLLRRLLDYAGHAVYDPGLVNLNEILARLFSASPQAGVPIRHEPGPNVGPATADETVLELSLLDAVATLSGRLSNHGSIVVRASEAGGGETEGAEVVVSLLCVGIAEQDLSVSDFALARLLAELAGGRLTIAAPGNDKCEVRLHLPRAVSSSDDGVTFS
ncbi:MAG: hypothetical protein ACREFC_02945 [Stellaceae bacterium]